MAPTSVCRCDGRLRKPGKASSSECLDAFLLWRSCSVRDHRFEAKKIFTEHGHLGESCTEIIQSPNA